MRPVVGSRDTRSGRYRGEEKVDEVALLLPLPLLPLERVLLLELELVLLLLLRVLPALATFTSSAHWPGRDDFLNKKCPIDKSRSIALLVSRSMLPSHH